jgi:hypothetical protein
MKVKRWGGLGLSLAIAAVAVMAFGSSTATSNHVRPQGATPVLVSMAIAYQPCVGTGNRLHGGGLPFPSCNPPVQASPNLQVGTPPANGAAAQGQGSIRVDVCPVPGCAAPNVRLEGHAKDVRCKAAIAPCGAANTADGPDYIGELQGTAQIRITDHVNDTTPTPTCGTNVACKTATVNDIPFPVTVQCVSTDASIGSSCDIVTTANSVVPNAVVANAQGNVEIQQIQVTDGGSDGVVGTPGNSLFAVQGIFIP